MADEKALADLVVNDRFWLAYAQEAVRNAVAAPERRAEQLAAGIVWFWTLYSAAALVALTTGSARLSTPAAWLVALPSAVLVLAYWTALRVRRPMLIDFDPRVPEEIEQAHHAAAQQKRRLLQRAERMTVGAAASVVLALATGLLGSAPAPAVELSATVDPHHPARLLVWGSVGERALVLLSAQPASAPAAAASAVVWQERADEKGVLRASLPLTGGLPQRVTATWTEDRLERRAALTVDH